VFAVIVMSVCVRDTWDLSTEHPLNRQHAKNACMTMIGTRSRYERQWVWLFPLHSFLSTVYCDGFFCASHCSGVYVFCSTILIRVPLSYRCCIS